MKKLLTALLSATLLFTSLPTLHNTYAEVSKTITKEIDLTKQYEVTNIFDGDTIAIKIDGEEIGKWVELEYHKDGKTLKKDTCYWYERR